MAPAWSSPERNADLRARGINYDTGFSPSGHNTRETFEPAQVEQEMRVIADELHCDAVRISGGDPERISVAARYAVAAGLEVWFSPFPNVTHGGLGWAVVDWDARTLKEPLERDEQEQVRYATELLEVFERLGVDTAFWFTFAGYGLPFHEAPTRDLDMASYGVVKMTPQSATPWERKAVFETLASSNAGNRAARTSTPVSPNAVG